MFFILLNKKNKYNLLLDTHDYGNHSLSIEKKICFYKKKYSFFYKSEFTTYFQKRFRTPLVYYHVL